MSLRASYTAAISDFVGADSLSVLGMLAQGQQGDLTAAQRDAWLQQIDILKLSLPASLDGMILFEFIIPRIGKRADNVLLLGNQVIVIEFKVGSDNYDQAAKNQVVDVTGLRTSQVPPSLPV